MQDKKTQRIISTFFIVTAVTIIFVAGYAFGLKFVSNEIFPPRGGELKNEDTLPEYLTQDVDFAQFWDVWNYVKENYVSADVPETKLFYGALAGMVASLQDPYSVFFNPEINEKFEQELSGSFEGIGAEIGIRDEVLTVIAPLPSMPAEKAGLRAGDRILQINDQDTIGMALDIAVNAIRGPKGSQVRLVILPKGAEETREVTITRDSIEIDSVRLADRDGVISDNEPRLLEGDIAYVQLLYFNENTLADWNQTMQQVTALNPRGVILDLRNNPGGYLGTAIEIAGEWVNGDVVVKEQLRDGTKIQHTARRQARFAEVPTVVLINGGSASGSEIVAGALQDYDKATLVGETTFGKGSVQDLRTFRDGSAVKLTIAEWLTPNDRNINKSGIVPDVVVELTKEDVDADRDPQLDKAIELLK